MGRQFGRRKPSREARPTVAIWCEGSGTEPAYFGALKKEVGLSNAKVAGHGSIRELQKKTEMAVRQDTIPDEVWYVIDHDEREAEIEGFQQWVHRKTKSLSKTKLRVIMSVPCFEYWLLIHFEDTTRPFHGLERRSACQQVIRELKKHFPTYKKNDPNVYDRCRHKLEHAIAYGRQNAGSGHSRTDV